MKNFRLFQTQEIAHNFEFWKNGGKFSKRVKTAVRKGEISCYEQFLLLPQHFQKTCTTDT